jgi:hypothetical protein
MSKSQTHARYDFFLCTFGHAQDDFFYCTGGSTSITAYSLECLTPLGLVRFDAKPCGLGGIESF